MTIRIAVGNFSVHCATLLNLSNSCALNSRCFVAQNFVLTTDDVRLNSVALVF